MAVYSFLDVQCAMHGPAGLNFSIANTSGIADEGISVDMLDDKGSMITGADGSVMHSLHAATASRVTIRLLKTSPMNKIMTDAYNFQTTSSAFYGQNTISIKNPVSQDSIVAENCGFARMPTNTNAKTGGLQEWVFNCGHTTHKLGKFPGGA